MILELHSHTRENDIVVTMDAPDIVDAYKRAGYDGIVITNHYFGLSFEWYKDELEGATHRQVIDRYLRGYRAAKARGDEIGMAVLLGIELRFDGTINDYLVYGIDEDFLYNAPLLNRMSLDSFLKILPENALVYQAHPFRDSMAVTAPSKLFGVEVWNGGTAADRNEFADAWAEKYGLSKISGSDFHCIDHLARGGAVFENEIHSERELANELRFGRYTLIKR